MATPPAPNQNPHSTRGLSGEEFSRLFHESFHLLWLIGVGITGDRHLAEDIVQEAAVRGLSKLDEFSPGTNFNAWMGRIVQFVAMNERRKATRRSAQSLDAVDAAQLLGTQTNPAIGSGKLESLGTLPGDPGWFDDQLTRALADLAPTPRACLLLRVVGGLDYAEISETLQVPTGTAMSHVHRTRKLLRQRLQPVEQSNR